MLNRKRSETDGYALEREGLSRMKMGQERSRSAGALNLCIANCLDQIAACAYI